MFWTPYADWIYVVVSVSGMLLIIVLCYALKQSHDPNN